MQFRAKFAAIRCSFTCSFRLHVQRILVHHVISPKSGLQSTNCFCFRFEILFLAFPNPDIFDMQRFFTCVIKIQCDMLLCYVNNNETPAKLSEVDANGIIPLPIRTTVLVG